MNSKCQCKIQQYSKKIYVGEYFAKVSSNIPILWLHKNDWFLNFSVKLNTSKKIPILVYFAKFNTNNSTLWLPKNDCSCTFSIQPGIIRKFILGNILLNSILIFQFYDCIKTIDMPILV